MATKFDFSAITKAPAGGAQRFCLYGPPKIGKTRFVCDIPNLFLICPEDGLAGIDSPAAHFPRSPRNLSELFEAIDEFGQKNVAVDGKRPFNHLAIDSLSWVERMVHAAACSEERAKHMDSKEYKVVWSAAAAIWQDVIARVDRVRRSGVHVWLIAHGMQTDQSTVDGSTWKKWDLELHKNAAPLWRKEVDHMLFMNWGARVVKEKGKRSVGKYSGRVIFTRENADHFAGSRSSAPDQIPATWADLRVALAAPAPAPDAKLRASIAAVLEEIVDVESKAIVEKDLAAAKTGRDLAQVLSRAQALRAIAAEDEPDDAAADPVAPDAAQAPATQTQEKEPAKAEAEDDGEPEQEDSAAAPLDAEAPPASSPRPTANLGAIADTAKELAESDKARAVVDAANDGAAIKAAFVAISKMKSLSAEERSSFAAELNKKKTALVGAA